MIVAGVMLVVAAGILGFMTFNLWAEWSAVAFVPSDKVMIKRALKLLEMKRGGQFWDLGSGDGRVVRMAVNDYGVEGVGIEINPFLTKFAQWTAGRNPKTRFVTASLWAADFSGADYIYCYLSPKAMKKLGDRFDKELKRGALVVSRAFAIPQMQQRLVRQENYPEGQLFLYRF